MLPALQSIPLTLTTKMRIKSSSLTGIFLLFPALSNYLPRAGTLTGPCQVIGLSLDPNEKWGLLSAISSPDGGKTINGHMQLCLIEGQKSQILDGHCGAFGEVLYHDKDYKSTIITFFERKLNETTQRVHITEIGIILTCPTSDILILY